MGETWTEYRRPAKRRCPKCRLYKIPNQFKRDEKTGWCRSCRNFVASLGDQQLGGDRWRAGSKHECPQCHKKQIASQFKRDDPDGWCRACRGNWRPPMNTPPPPSSLKAEIKLGEQRVLRVRVVGGVAVLTSGRFEKRQVSEVFLECATITLPFRVLPEVRAALTRAGRLQRKATV